MTREEFIEILDEKGYSYEIVGDKIVVTYNAWGYYGDVGLDSLTSLPPSVQFNNERDVYLASLKALPPGVEFNNEGNVFLKSLIGGWFISWKGNIKGIDSNRLLNKMIELGLFDRR